MKMYALKTYLCMNKLAYNKSFLKVIFSPLKENLLPSSSLLL